MKIGTKQLSSDGPMGQSVPDRYHRMPERVLSRQVVVVAQVRSAFSQPESGEKLLRQFCRLSALHQAKGQGSQGLRVLQARLGCALSQSVVGKVQRATRERRFSSRHLKINNNNNKKQHNTILITRSKKNTPTLSSKTSKQTVTHHEIQVVVYNS